VVVYDVILVADVSAVAVSIEVITDVVMVQLLLLLLELLFL
jgi:hypothetical protein